MLPALYNTTIGQPKIVGGYAADIGDAPYQVAINYDGNFKCGGSIISTVLVLTAAHCVLLIDSPKIYKFQVLAGVHDRSAMDNETQIRNVKFIYVHENYDRRTLGNDIAIFVLSAPLRYNKKVKYINLPNTHEHFEGNATVSGWGTTMEGSNSTWVLRKITIPVVSSNVCRSTYAFVGPHLENMLCIGGESGKASCRGDSGGPAVCSRDNFTPVLCGIVSSGIGCGRSGIPGLYTKVANYIDWIENTEKEIYNVHRNSYPHDSQLNKFIGCIPDTFICSANANYADDSNKPCNMLTQCRSRQFRCNNGRCISRDYTCDSDDDCGDGSDEERCKAERKNCGSGYQCGVYGDCIKKASVCDGKEDCLDGSDEENCNPKTLKKYVLPPPCSDKMLYTHYCSKDFMCIPGPFWCDGEVDCPSGSDELNCESASSIQKRQELRDWVAKVYKNHCFLSYSKADPLFAAIMTFAEVFGYFAVPINTHKY